MANFTGLAAGRHALLQKLGWDVEKQGLIGAPEITVVTPDSLSRATIVRIRSATPALSAVEYVRSAASGTPASRK